MSNILFVCTANICRSPAAEAIARSRFSDIGNSYASAGFMYDGREITPEMVRTLNGIGIDARDHESRILDAESAATADLILTMESRHVQDIGVMSADLFDRTIPLREAGERLSGRRLQVSEFVSELPNRDPRSYLDDRWDVEDPYKRSKRKYRKAVEELSLLVDVVLGAVA